MSTLDERDLIHRVTRHAHIALAVHMAVLIALLVRLMMHDPLGPWRAPPQGSLSGLQQTASNPPDVVRHRYWRLATAVSPSTGDVRFSGRNDSRGSENPQIANPMSQAHAKRTSCSK
jgi:hypothetical protein